MVGMLTIPLADNLPSPGPRAPRTLPSLGGLAKAQNKGSSPPQTPRTPATPLTPKRGSAISQMTPLPSIPSPSPRSAKAIKAKVFNFAPIGEAAAEAAEEDEVNLISREIQILRDSEATADTCTRALTRVARRCSNGLRYSELEAFAELLSVAAELREAHEDGSFVSALSEVIALAAIAPIPRKPSDLQQTLPHVAAIRALGHIVIHTVTADLQAAAADAITRFLAVEEPALLTRHQQIAVEAGVAATLVQALFYGLDDDARDAVLRSLCALSAYPGNERAMMDGLVVPLLRDMASEAVSTKAPVTPLVFEIICNLGSLVGHDVVDRQVSTCWQ